jgi:beta-glucanase (GH16 family)
MRLGQILFSAVVLVLSGCQVESDDVEQSEMHGNGDWELVWSDEFNGSTLDLSRWSYQIGDGCDINLCGWGNNELQSYTTSNTSVKEGTLTIVAIHDSSQSLAYTSSRIRTIGKGDWKYGRLEIRAALPIGQGLWPAIWMMPTDNDYGSWAASGEIDIMEALGHQPDRVYGTLHYGSQWPNNTMSGDTLFFENSTIAEYHEYAIEWEENEIRWYVDGSQYGAQTKWHSNDHKYPAPFDRRFYLILNVAIGGDWPGSPDVTTEFPQEMKVDYVRVYQRK